MCKRFWIVILNILIVLYVRTTLSAELQFDALKKQHIIEKQSRDIMSPKMDYDEWTPLGRGDPLKNDPTFDYSPPMVSKVKYWMIPSLRTPDPPIRPNKDYTSEANLYTAATTSPSKSTLNKQSDIRRFYIDFKDSSSDMAYVQSLSSKYNNKPNRPQQFQYQNRYYVPTRQPPAPLPMLVPPPPVEPNNYSSTKLENSAIIEFSQVVENQESTTHSSTSSTSVSSSSVLFTTPKSALGTPKITPNKSVLQSLLVKEKSSPISLHHFTSPTNPTAALPLTPNPVPFTLKQNTAAPKPPTYLIIQGHSKVKKYGGTSKLERSDIFQDTNDINDIIRYELPKDVRTAKHVNLEDFLPFHGALKETFKDIVNDQAEGSGFAAELTKAVFPSYIRPSTTLIYESPRVYDYIEGKDQHEEEVQIVGVGNVS